MSISFLASMGSRPYYHRIDSLFSHDQWVFLGVVALALLSYPTMCLVICFLPKRIKERIMDHASDMLVLSWVATWMVVLLWVFRI